jgi:hypothetical protein
VSPEISGPESILSTLSESPCGSFCSPQSMRVGLDKMRGVVIWRQMHREIEGETLQRSEGSWFPRCVAVQVRHAWARIRRDPGLMRPENSPRSPAIADTSAPIVRCGAAERAHSDRATDPSHPASQGTLGGGGSTAADGYTSGLIRWRLAGSADLVRTQSLCQGRRGAFTGAGSCVGAVSACTHSGHKPRASSRGSVSAPQRAQNGCT